MREEWVQIARRTNVAATLLAVAGLWPAGAAAQEGGAETPADDGAYCSATTAAVYEACLDEARADYKLEVGKCLNIVLNQARANCLADAQDARDEDISLCKTQRVLRRNICAALGEARYEPKFDPARFDQDLGNLTNPNPYIPLVTGYHWEFEGSEHVTVEVLDKVKLIAGNHCFVVNDRVIVDGVVVENTDDWFAHAKNGDVYYAGELSGDFETFEGDVPPDPELITLEGSFKTRRDRAKPGIAFFRHPHKGKVYRQEYDLNNAEDMAEIISTTYAFGADPELDRFVPQDLAELLCAGDCIVVREFTPLSPEDVERKYYAPGIGNFLGIHVETGERVQLVQCNFDTRCDALPSP
jgi:hypothetical protein